MTTSVSDDGTVLRVIDWEQFSRIFARKHRDGEHVAIVGPTGSGKSTCGLMLCRIIAKRTATDGRPARVVVIPTKPRDSTVTQLLKDWPVIKKWPPAYGQEHCIVWPRSNDPETMAARQRQIVRPLLKTIYHEGGQTIYLDEASKFETAPPEGLGLSLLMNEYWTSARSLDLTLIAGTQRPRHVTRSMWSEPSWVFIFKPEDEDDLIRVAQLSGARQQVMEIVPRLGGHEFVCVRRQRDLGVKKLYISKVA